MRLLLACDFFVRYSAGLAGGLARAGNEVTLLTRDHQLEFGARPGAAREFVRRAAGAGVRHRELSGRMRSPNGLLQAARLRGELRGLQPAVKHLQSSITNDPRLLLAAGIRPGCFALTVHDPSPHPGDRVLWRHLAANRMLARTAGLIFVHGESLRDELAASVAPRAPIVVVPHGTDRPTEKPLPEHPSVLFFGRMSRYKGLDVLLDAMAEVWRRVPGATLAVAGSGPIDDHPTLRDPRVTLRHEHVPDDQVPAMISGSTCVVLPYRQASQSGVGSLVKPYGRPLIVSSVGALPELVADGSGLIVPPEEPARLAEALISVLADRTLAQRLGDAGARTAGSEASWDAVAALSLRAYRRHLC